VVPKGKENTDQEVSGSQVSMNDFLLFQIDLLLINETIRTEKMSAENETNHSSTTGENSVMKKVRKRKRKKYFSHVDEINEL